MSRNLKLAYKADDSKRKSTFRKRKHGIIKKINEISTLCGIDACGIIYDENKSQATVCPSESGVQTVLERLRSFPKLDQRKLVMDHEDFLRQTIAKTKEKLRKQKGNTKKKDMDDLISDFIQTGDFDGNVSESDLEDLSSSIDKNIKEIEQRIEWIQDQEEV